MLLTQTGTRNIGLTLDWDYDHCKVHLFMPGYISKALSQLAHEKPSKPQHQPHPHAEKFFGATVQYAKALDNSPLLSSIGKTFIQQVLGVIMFLKFSLLQQQHQRLIQSHRTQVLTFSYQ